MYLKEFCTVNSASNRLFGGILKTPRSGLWSLLISWLMDEKTNFLAHAQRANSLLERNSDLFSEVFFKESNHLSLVLFHWSLRVIRCIFCITSTPGYLVLVLVCRAPAETFANSVHTSFSLSWSRLSPTLTLATFKERSWWWAQVSGLHHTSVWELSPQLAATKS